jgi:hypothetical protein
LPRNVRILAVALAAHLLVAPAFAVEQLDWCAPVVVRPDERFYTFTPPCEPWWPDDEIARRADFILDGFPRPSNSTIPADGNSCWGAKTMESSRAYHDRLRAAAAGYGRSLVFVYQARFDLVARTDAGTPGFDPAFLLDAQRSWRQVTDFFTRDRTPSCVCGCEWSDDAGAPGQLPGQRMRDLIDAIGGPDTYQHKIFYGGRPSSGGSAAGAPRRFFGVSAIADQTDPAYRAWRIGHMHDAIDVGGFDVVELNNKFSQYLPTEAPSYWGGSQYPNVSTYMAIDNTPWSSPIQGYGYPEYVAGWAAFADDLDAAGIPFSLTLQPYIWSANTVYDDPSTPTVNEADVIRAVARRAKYVLLARAPQFDQAALDAIEADIESDGVATVVIVDAACGNGGPPGRPPTQLAASLAIAPDAAITGHFDATTLRVDVFGAATGPWDADLWCHCPSPPCGAPDASVVGQTGTSWQVPIDTCDAAYATPIGTRVPRVEVRRSSYTAGTARNVTLCRNTCANGRDDDRDGFTDYPADAGCYDATDADETATTLACDDNVDNDHDGMIDYPADPTCTGPIGGESKRAACGFGAELVALVALGRRIRRRSA